MDSKLFFADSGLHIIVDGQFGSTGKGALAAFLADTALSNDIPQWGGVISNAGPNSGHTFYYVDTKHVLKQLPSFAVYMSLAGNHIPVYLSAGAVIDPMILADEANRYSNVPIFVHPLAAVVTDAEKDAEKQGPIAAVAGTRSGTGAAISRKIMRDPTAVFQDWEANHPGTMPKNVYVMSHDGWHNMKRQIMGQRFFMEISQGFSLGINQRFYPKCTSRECTVAQGLADAGLPPAAVSRTFMAVRTYPIRVGNVDGFDSGGHYRDQKEITWEELGVVPELTTVTQRVRRVFTWSQEQFEDALLANNPDFVFFNFVNYMGQVHAEDFAIRMGDMGLRYGFEPLWGYGPKVEDVTW